MNVYFDASVLVALLTKDALALRAEAFLRKQTPVVIVSDFAAAEFASAIARRVRVGEVTAEGAREAFSIFDAWIARDAQQINVTAPDIISATAFIRRLDLPLRAGDAINIAIAQRIGADLVTFDDQMAAGARALGLTVLAD